MASNVLIVLVNLINSFKNLLNQKIWQKSFLLLTLARSTKTVGLAEGYRRNTILIPTPKRIPYSTPTVRQAKNVANVHMRSFLLLLHIGFTTSYSIMKMTALTITAPKEAFGM